MSLNFLTINHPEDMLSSYAQKSSVSLGRRHPEIPHPFRNPYQRDRDRIVYCRAFRRLADKAQVLIHFRGDHYRTRLTHSIEVSQVSRCIARVLQVHEDLVETIALAHDLGHPPFGHAGEAVLNHLMEEDGGFEHNDQSLRIVDLLENKYPDFPGLNLTHEVRHGLIKHRQSGAKPNAMKADYDLEQMPILEAQVVDLSDEIAYSCHDLEDGLSHGFLQWDEVMNLAIVQRLELPPSLKEGEVLLYHLVRRLIDQLVRDVVDTTQKAIQKNGIKTLQDITSLKRSLVGLSPDLRREFTELRRFLYHKFYKHLKILQAVQKAETIITRLFEYFVATPADLPESTQMKTKIRSLKRVVCDYIAGMTDHYAEEEASKRALV